MNFKQYNGNAIQCTVKNTCEGKEDSQANGDSKAHTENNPKVGKNSQRNSRKIFCDALNNARQNACV